MLANEEFYEKSDIKNMLAEGNVKEPGEHWAIGVNIMGYVPA